MSNENSHLNKELQNAKNNYDILNTKNKDLLKELNSKSYILSNKKEQLEKQNNNYQELIKNNKEKI